MRSALACSKASRGAMLAYLASSPGLFASLSFGLASRPDSASPTLHVVKFLILAFFFTVKRLVKFARWSH